MLPEEAFVFLAAREEEKYLEPGIEAQNIPLLWSGGQT